MPHPFASAGLAALLTALCPAQQAVLAQRPAALPVRVGTWNLEHLGQRKNPPRTDAAWTALGAMIRELDVAVLAVQEVRDAAAAQRLCTAIGPSWTFVIGTSGGFRESADGIRLGFVFDQDRVKLVDAFELLDVPREVDGVPIFHRVPITASFRVRAPAGRAPAMDFRLVTCHLKASQGEENQKKRCLEMGLLVDWLGGLAADADEDQDVLLLGDFNHTYGDPAFEVFERSGLGRYLRTDVPQPTIRWFDSPIDQIVAMKGIEDELVADSFGPFNERMLADKDAWRETYSDHVPVLVTLDGSIDRDPNAHFTSGPEDHQLPVGRMRPIAAPPATETADAVATTTTADDLPRALGRGDRVRVEVRGPGIGLIVHEGRLLAEPGEWVYLLTNSGLRASFPAENVFQIEERK